MGNALEKTWNALGKTADFLFAPPNYEAMENYVKLQYAASGLVKPEDVFPELRREGSQSVNDSTKLQKAWERFGNGFSEAIEDFTRSIKEQEDYYVRGLREALKR